MKRTALRLCIGIPAALLALSGGLLGGLTLWLTPDRLSGIASEKASRYLDADVELRNLRFTLWSSFPRFHLMSDSIIVRSRALASVPDSIRRQLPADCDTLLTASSFTGAVNLKALVGGAVKLHNVEMAGVNLNMVAVSDSVANYLIFPATDDTHRHIPEISANLVSLPHPGRLRFFSLQSGLRTDLDLKEARLEATDRKQNMYASLFAGDISAKVQGMQLLDDFPFRLKGDIGVDYRPLRFSFTDYSIALGNLNARASMSLDSENNPGVDSFSISTDAFRPLELLGYLPKALIPHLDGIEADLPLHLEARLTSPYRFSSSSLPSVEVDADIPEGSITYRMGNGRPVTAEDVRLQASLRFDGLRPDSSAVELRRLSMNVEGFAADLRARITDILSLPRVAAEISLQGDLKDLPRLASSMKDMKPDGQVDGNLLAAFTINLNDSVPAIIDLDLKAGFKSKRISLAPGKGEHAITGDSIHLAFASEGNIRGGVPSLIRPTDLMLDIDRIAWSRGDMEMSARNLGIKGTARLFTSTANAFDSLLTTLSAGEIRLSNPRNSLEVKDYSTTLSLRHATARERHGLKPAELPAGKDAEWLEKTPHTPAYITRGNAKGLTEFMAGWRMATDISASSARWAIRDYPHPFLSGPLRMDCDFDRLDITRMSLSSGASSADITLHSEGWRRFFSFDTPQPITATIDLCGGTIDINQIARATHAASGSTKADDTGKSDRSDRSHTTPAWLIPRNLDAALHATARHTLYTNLDISGLDAELTLAGGDMDVEHLRLATDFGHANLSVSYPTSDIQALGAQAALQIEDVDVVRMFGKFHKLLEMAPEMKNLSGFVSVAGDVSIDIFPDMTTPMSSLRAALQVQGRQLKVRQNRFIHHLARMMLILNHKDIDIADMDIQASVHDNLLELRPFIFGFDRYRLRIEGVNNFNGDLDYHIGVLRSPLPMKFGINVEGTYHHPHLRFASPYWDVRKAWNVTSHITKSFEWNFVDKMRWAGNEFMKKAASGTSL